MRLPAGPNLTIETHYHAQGNMVLRHTVATPVRGDTIDVIGSTKRNDNNQAPTWFELNEIQVLDNNGRNVASTAVISKLVASSNGRATSLVVDGKKHGQSNFVAWNSSSRFAGKAVLRLKFRSAITISKIVFWTTNMESFGSNPGVRVQSLGTAATSLPPFLTTSLPPSQPQPVRFSNHMQRQFAAPRRGQQ